MFRRTFTIIAATLLLVSSASAIKADATEPVERAAAYLISQVDDSHLDAAFGAESITAEAVIALTAAGQAVPETEQMTTWLEGRAKEYSATGEGAAKLALVAEVVGKDPRNFGGVDLIEQTLAGIQPDGSFGASPSPYSAGLAAVALKRAGVSVPAELTDWLAAQQEADGGFSYSKGQPADADNTALAALGLTPYPAKGGVELPQPVLDAMHWAEGAQQSDGHWEGFSPINSTAVLGSLLSDPGVPNAAAATWLTGQQLADGGFPASADGTDADLFASIQALLFLSGYNYLTAGAAASPESPATTSAACPGVLVVVDPGSLGGSPLVGCATEYSTGYTALISAGFSIETTSQGMLCQVNGMPETCVTSTTAYWSYWHSTADGSWEYSDLGGGTYKPPSGAVEGWVFGDGSVGPQTDPDQARPNVTPTSREMDKGMVGPDGSTVLTIAVIAVLVAGAIVAVVVRRRNRTN